MEKAVVNRQNPDLLDEYNFSKGARGKYVLEIPRGHKYC